MQPAELLKEVFGYETFREGQEQMIHSILSGRDVLGIMPTGAGKSICYQIPALLSDGVTIIVSPLISLMNDQVKALNEAGVHAAYINSSLTETQIEKCLQYAYAGRYRMIYVAPERLLTDRFLAFAGNVRIPLLTVDEAHCVSQWGQDFRPAYLDIIKFVEHLPTRPVLAAFTATATARVREDIRTLLDLKNPDLLLTGFDRPNLYFSVRQGRGRAADVLRYVSTHPEESGMIYCATRKNVEMVHETLVKSGVRAVRYHAGLSQEERKRAQEQFIYDEAPVIVATNAFGMGIDKSNVRYVLHYNMPQSMEHYYQEAGRAGRDGAPAECVLYFSPQDIVINRLLLSHKEQNPQEQDEEESASYGMSAREIDSYDEYRLKEMIRYCRTAGCLRAFILRYFGEDVQEMLCGNCENCSTDAEETDATEIAKQVLNCIYETNARYGAEKVMRILRGAGTKDMTQIRAERYKTFGVLRETDPNMLRATIDALLSEEYLVTSEDRYQILSLTPKIRELREPGKRLTVLSRKAKAVESAVAGKTGGRKPVRLSLAEKETGLFEHLRRKRMEIAKEQRIPPYMVFSDKTLIELCVLRPESKEALLQVSGIGLQKAEKYGELFLEAIAEYDGDSETEGVGGEGTGGAAEMRQADEAEGTGGGRQGDTAEMRHAAGAAKQAVPGGKAGIAGGVSSGTPGKKVLREKDKQDFFLTEEWAGDFHPEDRRYLAELTEQMNLLRDEKTVKKLYQKNIREKLMQNGYITDLSEDGYTDTALTSSGEQFGLELEEITGRRGHVYHLLRFSEAAQMTVLSWFVRQ